MAPQRRRPGRNAGPHLNTPWSAASTPIWGTSVRTDTPRVEPWRPGRGPGVGPRRRTPSRCATSSAIASRTGLAHVFGELPYPDDDVLARWALLLDDPEVSSRSSRTSEGWSSSPPTTAPRCATWPSAPTTGAPGWGARGSSGPRPPGRDGCGCWRPTDGPAALYESLGWTPTGAHPGVPLGAVPDRGRVRRSLGSGHAGRPTRCWRSPTTSTPCPSRTSRLPATRWSRSTRPTRRSPPRSRGCARRRSRRGWSTCSCAATPTRSTRCSPSARRCATRRRTSTPPSCASSPSSAAS